MLCAPLKSADTDKSLHISTSAVNFNKYALTPLPKTKVEFVILMFFKNIIRQVGRMFLLFCHLSPETVWLKRKGKMADDTRAVKSHKMALDRRKALSPAELHHIS